MSGLKLVSLDVVGGGQTRRDAFKPAWRTHIPAVKRDIFLGRRRCNSHFPVSAKQTSGVSRQRETRRRTRRTRHSRTRRGETPGRVLTRLALFGLWRD